MENAHEQAQAQAEQEFTRILDALNLAVGSKPGGRNFAPVRRGTGISTSWLSAFADGKLQEAGFKRLLVLGSWLRANGYLNNKKDIQAVAGVDVRHQPARDPISPGESLTSRVSPSFCSGTDADTPISADGRSGYEVQG